MLTQKEDFKIITQAKPAIIYDIVSLGKLHSSATCSLFLGLSDSYTYRKDLKVIY